MGRASGGAQRCVGEGQAKKSREPDGLYGGPNGLQGPPQWLAAHIDTKSGLHLNLVLVGRGTAGIEEPLSQLALVADFQSYLPHFVDQQSLLCPLQQGGGLAPGLLQRLEGMGACGIVLAMQQNRTPCQPDRQQLPQVRVGRLVQVGLPA